MSNESMAEHRTARFGILLGSLVLFFVVLAITAEQPTESVFARMTLTLALIAGLYAGSGGQRWVLIAGLGLLVPAVATSFASGPDAFGSASLIIYEVRYATTAAFLLFASIAVFLVVLQEHEVSTSTIIGGISVYLLIGIAFINLYVLVEVMHPGSIEIGGRTLTEIATDPAHTDEFTLMLYFSFTTLTTLGYGDIHPVRPIAQLLANTEAVIGQLYVAIFVARLVALHTANWSRAKQDAQINAGEKAGKND